jgi:DNA-binding NtrC family response regulator
MAVENLEGRLESGSPVVIRAPAGLDVAPFLARAHLSGARRKVPLVLVDGTDPHEHGLARWCDAAESPLVLADGGILALIDASAFPPEIQALVGRACQEGLTPWDSQRLLRVQLVATTVGGPDDAPALRFDDGLAAALGDACSSPILLPRLQERADDFRALLLDLLAREGLRSTGRPVGIEPAAYAKLAEYEFPGDSAELVVVVRRLVERCRGDAVRTADVDSLGLPGIEPRPSAAGEVRGRVRKDPISA